MHSLVRLLRGMRHSHWPSYLRGACLGAAGSTAVWVVAFSPHRTPGVWLVVAWATAIIAVVLAYMLAYELDCPLCLNAEMAVSEAGRLLRHSSEEVVRLRDRLGDKDTQCERCGRGLYAVEACIVCDGRLEPRDADDEYDEADDEPHVCTHDWSGALQRGPCRYCGVTLESVLASAPSPDIKA